MPEPESTKWSQAGVFMVAAALGIVVMVVVPKQCRNNSDSTAGNGNSKLLAPEPDTVESHWAAKNKAGASAVAVQGKVLTSNAQFEEAATALSFKSAEELGEALDELMTAWVAANPAAAAAWVQKLPDGAFRESAGTSLGQAWAAADPKAAAAWVAQNLNGSKLQGALGAVASGWAEKDPLAVVDWLEGLKEESDRSAGEAALAQRWGEADPAMAASWLLQLPTEHQSANLQSLLTGWSSTDPAAAAAWLQGALVENPQLPIDSAAVVVATWSEKNAGDVSKWLNALPEGPLYQAAATAFAQTTADTSPHDSLLWSRALANPNDRRGAVSHAVETWMENDWKGFVTALPKELEATTDPALRQVIYDALYRKDPAFKDQMLKLVETPDTPGNSAGSGNGAGTFKDSGAAAVGDGAAPASPDFPAAEQAAPSPVEGDEPQ